MNPVAVVVGGDLNPLGIIRSLREGLIPTIVMATDPREPAMRSRYGRKVTVAAVEGQPLVDALLDLARSFDKPAVLFPTEERTVRTVSERRAALEKQYLLRLPPHNVLMALMHKQGFRELAEVHRATVPRTLHLQGMADLLRLDELRYPCVLKPAYKHYGYGNRFKKAYVVHSASETMRLYKEIAPTLADMVLQEWIDGADHDIYFCLQYVGKGGVTVSSFTGRKIRSWPPRIGGTASCIAAWDAAAELEAQTADFFRQVGFTGMGSMEFKRDSRDGRYYMVEPTVARTDFQEEVATLNGVNIPLAAYCYECNLPAPAAHRASPVRVWREPVTDRWSRSEQGPAPEDLEAGTKMVDAYFRLPDPLPWVDLITQKVSQKIKSRLAR